MNDETPQNLSGVLVPVAKARGLPNAHYTDPATCAEETEALLFSKWAGVGFGKDIPNPGDVKPVDFLGVPLLLVRDENARVRVFQNTCRHRGMILVEEACNVRGTLRCPYHSWCYSLNGQLRATPHVGGPGQNIHDEIKRDDLSLDEFPSAMYRDVIFTNVSRTAPPFSEYAAKLIERWKDHDKPLYSGGATSGFTFDVACNWKLAVENYCEAYHLPWIHPGLNSYSRLEDHEHIEEPGHFAGQITHVYRQFEDESGNRFPDFDGLPPWWDKGAEYIAFFPNVLFAAQRDHAYAMLLMPQGHERTIEQTEIYYAADPATRPDLKDMIDRNAELWKGVLEEDIFVVEGMQKGRHGPLFDGGKFSPVMDSPTHVFHQWCASEIEEHRARRQMAR